ncbi:beta strand repeat-containing protein [Methanobacterium aggregans]|uniref:beta strand repeat-containing protein n=1 Tax=Methanobacterium aggregans TaxID=1615586 RepID=UPI001AE189C9|nr:Ig-like domain repeat protein [Methanobacterium aggregans]MBP2044857.1 putative outer membrane repeat protein [Methanobacterium aggregans]
MVSVSAVSATDIYVNTTGNDTIGSGTAENPFLTIEKGVNTAKAGDNVNIADGTYSGTGNTNITINKNMNITGQSQAGTIINGTSNNWIFRISKDMTVTIKNITLTQGNTTGTGGAIDNRGTLTVVNCNFTDNHANTHGGAIFNEKNLTVSNCTFNNNDATYYGGAIQNGNILYPERSRLNVQDSSFTDNHAGNGGAISNWGTSIIASSNFTSNNALEGSGGAIYNDGGIPFVGNLTVTNSNFTKNVAGDYNIGNPYGHGYGGAICTKYGDLNVDGCTFTGENALRGEGGAIYSLRSNSKVTSSSFTGNWVYRGSGGAIYSEGTSFNPNVLTVINCSFIKNIAQTDGGAIGSWGSSIINITGSNFTNNTANNYYGGAIKIYGTLTVTDCSFTNNTSNYFGGAIGNHGVCTVTSSSFLNNTSREGGAIWGSGRYVKVTNSNFTGNLATNGNWGYGGGAIGTMCNLDVINCTFTANNASYDGAAIWNSNVTQIVNCTFTNNHAESGAIWNTGDGTCTVTGSSFIGNTAGFGAGIENYGIITIDRSSFLNNRASNGGAISHLGKSLTITNSNFTGNMAINGGVIWAAYNSHSSTGPFSISRCIFTGNRAVQGSVVWNDRGSDTGVMHFNRIFGNTGKGDVYSASGAVDAENNWWGDNFNGTHPGAAGRVNSNVDADPWIVLRWSASPTTLVGLSGTSTATADMRYNSNDVIPGGSLPDGTVTFAVNNSGNLNPVNGTMGSTMVATTFTPTKYGLSTITATVDGFSLSTSVLVEGTSTSLTVGAASGYKGDNTTLTARLWDTDSNKAVAGETVDFYVNGVYVGQGTTDANGVARYTYSITQNVGTYTINATFNATTQYEPSNGTNTLTVDATPTSLTVGAASGYKGDNTTLIAILWDTAHDRAVAGETVDFYVNGDYVGQGTTDSNGLATCNYSIIQNTGTYTTNATFNATTQYAAANGADTLTVDATPTSLTVDNVTGNKGTNVTLKATLTDTAHNVVISGKNVTFKVNGTTVGTVTTDANGVATLLYNIKLVGGNYTVDAVFAADDQYAGSNVTGTLKVPQSSIYVVVTSSKKDPGIGETFTLTYKLGNNGPDEAENVTITIPLPEGFELSNISGDGNWTYNETRRTITWTFTDLAVGDPYLYITGKLGAAGAYLFSSSIAADTYNSGAEGVTPITINVEDPVAQVNAAGSTVAMQETGTPINYLLIAVLVVLSGLMVPKKK